MKRIRDGDATFYSNVDGGAQGCDISTSEGEGEGEDTKRKPKVGVESGSDVGHQIGADVTAVLDFPLLPSIP